MTIKSGIVTALVLGILGMAATASYGAEGGQAPARHFLVLMGLGPGYDSSVPIQRQKGFPVHAAYIGDLESKGKIVFGGPLIDSFSSMMATGGVLVVRAETAEEARQLAAGDPSGMLVVQEVRAFLLASKPGPQR